MRDDFGNLFQIHLRLKSLIQQLQELDHRARAHHAVQWRPNVDIIENAAAIVYILELSGVDADGISAEIRSGVLFVSGNRPSPVSTAPGESYLCMERPFGAFSCEFVLDTCIEVESAAAQLADGELRITLQKKSPSTTGTIRLRIDV